MSVFRIKKAISLLLAAATLCAFGISASAEYADLDLSNEAVNEMFTKRDFDPSYEISVNITLADTASFSDSKAVRIDGDRIFISQEGVYKLSGALTNGQIIVNAADNAKVQLVLDGVSVSCVGGAAIQVAGADKVFVTTAAGSENALSSTGELLDKDVNGAVYSKNDICFNGEGRLSVNSENGHGIATKDDLKICSGSYEITALKRGLSGKDSIRIGGGDISVISEGDGLHSEHDEADKGYIFISGGRLNILSGSDGIDCTNYLSILSGSVSIEAGSDGINVAAADDANRDVYVSVSGGVMNIKAAEDGIDSNGSIDVSGGELYISAAPNGGDGALDYGSLATISGGTVAAASAREMAANFSEAAQGSMLCTFMEPHYAGEEVSVSDNSGNVLISFSPALDYQAVVFSCAGITEGGSYIVSAGEESVEISMDGTLYGGGFGMIPMGGPGGHGGMRPEGMPGERPEGMAPPDFGDGMAPPDGPGGMDKKPGGFDKR